MPFCHGSGGLAAQYRFGAKSGANIIFLGFIRLLVGFFEGRFAEQLFKGIPNAILGVMLIAVRLDLASSTLSMIGAQDLREAKDAIGTLSDSIDGGLSLERRKRRWTTMLFTVGGTLTFETGAAGVVDGMLCH